MISASPPYTPRDPKGTELTSPAPHGFSSWTGTSSSLRGSSHPCSRNYHFDPTLGNGAFKCQRHPLNHQSARTSAWRSCLGFRVQESLPRGFGGRDPTGELLNISGLIPAKYQHPSRAQHLVVVVGSMSCGVWQWDQVMGRSTT